MESTAEAAPKPEGGRPDAARAWVSDHRVPIICLLVFAASRAAYYAAGVRFETSDLGSQWQTIDLDALRSDYWGSIGNAHTVPPLYNASIGAALKWSPFSLATTFWLAGLALGVVLTLALARLLSNLGVSTIGIVATVAVIVANPGTVLFENWLFYEYPVAVGLVVIVCGFTELVRRPRVAPVVVVVTVAALITLTRSIFHPLWFVLVVALVVGLAWKLLCSATQRRAVLVAAAAPIVLVALVLVHSQQVAGTPSLSSWFGMNLSRTAMTGVPTAERARWVDEGGPSSLTSRPFQSYDTYRADHPDCETDASAPAVLREPTKSDGTPNFNHSCFLPVYDDFLRGSLESVRREPGAYLRDVVDAWQISMRRADMSTPLPNRERISTAYDLWGTVVLAQVDTPIAYPLPSDAPDPFPREDGDPITISLTFIGAVLVVLAAGTRALVRWVRYGLTVRRMALTLIGLLVAWTLVVGNASELPENNRFRFLVEPLLFVVLGMAIDRSVAWWCNRRASGSGAPVSTESSPLTRV